MGKQFEEFVAMTNFEIAFNRIKYSTRSRYKNFYKRDLESFSLFLTIFNVLQCVFLLFHDF